MRPALIARVIEQMSLSLRDLTVFTEAASGPYLWCPLLAAAAGADRVLALAADNRFHRAHDVEAATARAAAELGVEVDVVRDKTRIAEADIVTNTGPVRPIDAAGVAALKPTAVVPLMWEPWEFLPGQVDLPACREKGILVLGTNEHEPPCDMVPYAGPLAIHALVQAGSEVVRSRVLLIGRQPTLGAEMARVLREVGAHVVEAPPCDVVLVADHAAKVTLPDLDDHVPIAVVSGDVDPAQLCGHPVWPGVLGPPGQMSASPADLGPRPVLELYAAGLRVGEVAARARLDGATVQEAARAALRDAPAMDLEGEDAWAT